MKSIHYTEKGKGPVLLFLHGFCETHEIWDEIVPQLSIHFRVITPDLPGFGESKPLSNPFTIKEVGQAVIDFLTKAKIHKCVIIGHSLGGYVALAIAEARPDLLEGLCLFHSTAHPDSDEKKLNRERVMDFVRKNGVQPFVETFVPGLFFQKIQGNIDVVYKIASKTSKDTVLSYSEAMRDRPNMTGVFNVLKKPVLFLAGEKDAIITISSLDLQSKLSNYAQLKVLNETGHMGMFEDTAGSIKILKDFARACFHPTDP